MLKRFTSLAIFVSALTVSFSLNSSAGTINLLSSDNVTWTADVGNATCTLLPRVSGDSIAASWTMKPGAWNNTWISIYGKPLVDFSNADSIKIAYTNDNKDGFSIRLTIIVNLDTSMWQSPYLNGHPLPQAATLPLNSTTFPIQFAKTGSTFRLDSLKSISFINNTNPTTIAAGTTVTGNYNITQLIATTKGASSVKPTANIESRISTGAIKISTSGFVAPMAGTYTVSIYNVNGAMVRTFNGNYKAGLNAIDFSKIGAGSFIVKVLGNGLTGSDRLVLSK